MSDLDDAKQRAIEFLHRSQLPSGEFPSYRCFEDHGEGEWHSDPSIFTSALVAYSLFSVNTSESREMIAKVKKFLIKEMSPLGLWQYCAAASPYGLPPDLDDTCCASVILNEEVTGDSTDELWLALNRMNRGILLDNRNEQGLFYTWIKSSRDPVNDIDSVVNANVLFYLKEFEEASSVVEYLYDVVTSDQEEKSYWSYTGTSCFYYMISRAFENGAKGLEICSDVITRKIIEDHRDDDSAPNEMDTAMDLCTLLNFSCGDAAALRRLSERLVTSQKDDGAWSRVRFMQGPPPPSPISVWYGSEMATTGICLEALAKYSFSRR